MLCCYFLIYVHIFLFLVTFTLKFFKIFNILIYLKIISLFSVFLPNENIILPFYFSTCSRELFRMFHCSEISEKKSFQSISFPCTYLGQKYPNMDYGWPLCSIWSYLWSILGNIYLLYSWKVEIWWVVYLKVALKMEPIIVGNGQKC